MKKLLVGFLTAIITAGLFIVPAFAEENEGFVLRNGIKFGDSVEEVEDKETFNIVEDDIHFSDDGKITSIHTENGSISGYDGNVAFLFDDEEKLTDMEYSFYSLEDDLSNQYETLYEGLSRKYGEPLDIPEGNIYIFTGNALSNAIELVAGSIAAGGNGEILNVGEWLVECGDYKVKIEIVRYSIGFSNIVNSEILDIGYTYLTDDDLAEAQEDKQDRLNEIDNDL